MVKNEKVFTDYNLSPSDCCRGKIDLKLLGIENNGNIYEVFTPTLFGIILLLLNYLKLAKHKEANDKILIKNEKLEKYLSFVREQLIDILDYKINNYLDKEKVLYSYFIKKINKRYVNFLYPPDLDTNSIVGLYLLLTNNNFSKKDLDFLRIAKFIDKFIERIKEIESIYPVVWLYPKSGNKEIDRKFDYGVILNHFSFLHVILTSLKDNINNNSNFSYINLKYSDLEKYYKRVLDIIRDIYPLQWEEKRNKVRYYFSELIIYFLELYTSIILLLNEERKLDDNILWMLINIFLYKLNLIEERKMYDEIIMYKKFFKCEGSLFKLGSKNIFFCHPISFSTIREILGS